MSAARLITRWATQAGREPAALSRARARLDTRGFADLLAEAAHLAGLVGFQEGERLLGGDWRGVLAADPTMVLALLATIDVESRSEGLQALLERARACDADEAKQLLGRLLDGLLRFAAELDEWLAPAAAGAAVEGHAAHRMIEASIENVLGPMLRTLLVEVAAAEEAGLLHNILPHHHRQRLRRRWRLAVLETELAALRHEVERAWVDRLLDQVAQVAEAFVHEMREIGERGAAALGPSLASGRHPAHVALLLAFAEIFRHAQDRLNDVPQRLARFYHEEVLRVAPRGAAPDSLFLTIEPRPGARPHVARGSLVAAGRDESGEAIEFAADTALDATGALLAAARLWTPVRNADGRIARVDAALFAVGPDGAVGEDKNGLAAAGTRVAVAPAAVIAAPELRLAGGTRRIVLTLACAPLPAAIIPALLRESLGVAVSTDEGWIDLKAAGVSVHWYVVADAIALSAVLPPDLPALAPCPAGTPDAPVEAAIRLALRQDAAATLPLWTLFSGITLAGAGLQIAVRDAGELVVSTPTGLASAVGAAPFGSPPYPGGWLRIDHPVLAARPLDRVLLRMDWAGLPTGRTGFEGYYREYVVDEDRRLRDPPLFTNLSFTVTMAAPVPGWDAARPLPLFLPADGAAAPDIFAPDERFETPPPPPAPDGPLAPASWFAAAASDAPAGPVPDHLFVMLESPAEGFGDAVYPANVAHATTLLAFGEAPVRRRGLLHGMWTWIKALLKELAALLKKALEKIGALLVAAVKAPAALIDRVEGFEGGYIEDWYDKADPEPEADPGPDFSAVLPNPPFRPLISAISLDYALTVTGSGLKLFHARPLETLGAVAGFAGAPLFAPLPGRRAVDFRLAGAKPGERQSILVRLGPSRGQMGERAKAPEYLYLAAAGWRTLPATLLSDATAGLSVTGILRVVFPADAAPAGGEDGLWLRILFAPDAPIPAILAVTPDAFSATRILAGGESEMAPVPAETVTRLPYVAGVVRVAQPLASAGGRPAETHAMLRRRTAERVRHRGRGVAAWDFERLVLSEFPGIARVRVLAAGDPAIATPCGDIKVVVLPAPGGADPPDPDRPRAAPQLRGAILKRLKEVASPFAMLDVVDPAYVSIDVKAEVRVEHDCAERLEAALAAFLSPWAEPGLDLDDHADEEAVRAALAAFLLALPGVAGIDRLDIALDDAAPAAAWRVPVAGVLTLVPIAAERAALPW